MNYKKLTNGFVRSRVKDNWMTDKNDRFWWGIHIQYKNGVTSDGGDKNLNSDEDAINRASEMANTIDGVEFTEAYRVDLPEGETLGTIKVLKRVYVLNE